MENSLLFYIQFILFVFLFSLFCLNSMMETLRTKKIVIERTRDLIYLKFVATDFFPKIISPSAGKNFGDSV